MENLVKQCKNFIERAIDNGDIKEIDYDAIREAIHDFCGAYDVQDLVDSVESELLPRYAKVIDIEGLTYDDEDLPEALELGETVFIIRTEGEAVLIESLNTGTLHYIDLERIELFKLL